MTAQAGRRQQVELVPLRWWHLAAVARLEQEVFPEDPWSPELFWSELAQGGQRYYLVATPVGAVPLVGHADQSTEVVGYAGLAVYGDEAYIQTLGVAAAYRRGGLASRLMVALLREARGRGAHTCGLEVRTDNDAARGLYARLGFRDVGIRRGYYQPSGADAYVMVANGLRERSYGDLLEELERGVR